MMLTAPGAGCRTMRPQQVGMRTVMVCGVASKHGGNHTTDHHGMLTAAGVQPLDQPASLPGWREYRCLMDGAETGQWPVVACGYR